MPASRLRGAKCRPGAMLAAAAAVLSVLALSTVVAVTSGSNNDGNDGPYKDGSVTGLDVFMVGLSDDERRFLSRYKSRPDYASLVRILATELVPDPHYWEALSSQARNKAAVLHGFNEAEFNTLTVWCIESFPTTFKNRVFDMVLFFLSEFLSHQVNDQRRIVECFQLMTPPFLELYTQARDIDYSAPLLSTSSVDSDSTEFKSIADESRSESEDTVGVSDAEPQPGSPSGLESAAETMSKATSWDRCSWNTFSVKEDAEEDHAPSDCPSAEFRSSRSFSSVDNIEDAGNQDLEQALSIDEIYFSMQHGPECDDQQEIKSDSIPDVGSGPAAELSAKEDGTEESVHKKAPYCIFSNSDPVEFAATMRPFEPPPEPNFNRLTHSTAPFEWPDSLPIPADLKFTASRTTPPLDRPSESGADPITERADATRAFDMRGAAKKAGNRASLSGRRGMKKRMNRSRTVPSSKRRVMQRWPGQPLSPSQSVPVTRFAGDDWLAPTFGIVKPARDSNTETAVNAEPSGGNPRLLSSTTAESGDARLSSSSNLADMNAAISELDGLPLSGAQIASDLSGFPESATLDCRWRSEIGVASAIFGLVTLSIVTILLSDTHVFRMTLHDLQLELREFHYVLKSGKRISVWSGLPRRQYDSAWMAGGP